MVTLRSRNLTMELVEALGDQIRGGRFAVGAKLPSEAAITAEFGVSRTVVREAISKLQASGIVETRHGIGTFVTNRADARSFRITPDQYATLQDVIAVLELRIAVEMEAASLAARRRTDENLLAMRTALADFAVALENGGDTVTPDFRFHLEIARATQNRHFVELIGTLGTQIIPRARLEGQSALGETSEQARVADVGDDTGADVDRRDYLRHVNSEHVSIVDAIASEDADGARAAMRTHLANSRERRRRAASLVR